LQKAIACRTELMDAMDLTLDDLMIDTWTSSTDLASAIQCQIEMTCEVLETMKHEVKLYDNDMDDDDATDKPKAVYQSCLDQLPQLVDVLLGALKERQLYLSKAGEPRRAQLKTTTNFYSEIQPKFIDMLVKYGKTLDAFQLAEKYKDFQSLVDLTLESSDQYDRIKEYTHAYQEAFAHVLYETYYRKGMRKELLDQPDEFGTLLHSYLDKRNVPGLAWIHEIYMNQFDHASMNLLKSASDETSVDKKKIALSLAKLCHVTHEPNEGDAAALDGNLTKSLIL
jgi:nuclear pore complex protein Nup133